MIQIEDYDMPIVAAEKIIRGQRPYNPNLVQKALLSAVGEKTDDHTEDMYSVSELREIADYLYVFCNAHADDELQKGERLSG